MIRSVGYDGSISETDWSAWLAPYLGSPPMVVRAPDFRVTPATGNLSVQVAPGTAHGWGITDTSDAAETIQLDPAPTGVRYDAIVLRRDWGGTSTTPTGSPTGGSTSIGWVKGGAAQAVPALTTTGGTLTEQPLALVKVTAGTTTVQVVDDLRATHAKAAYARSLLAMTGPPGTRYTLEPDGKRYVMTVDPASGVTVPKPEWEPPPPVIPPIPVIASGTRAVSFDDKGVAQIPHGLGRRPTNVIFSSRSTTSSGLVDVSLSLQAGAISSTVFTVVAKVMSNTSSGWAPYTGSLSYVDWIAYG